MILGTGSRNAFRDYLALLSYELLKEFGVLVIDIFDAHLCEPAHLVGLQHTHFASVLVEIIVAIYHNYSLISLDSSSVKNLSNESDVYPAESSS